ncbi:hypothetical protein CCR75_003180 [Bremia lactucae]|uniref:Uncharacterized protein n=1 Tax=Bremia lactucae TaxID=4779 RepID=A0A976FLR5_BRELC|nr:hypothetical protein CCR75_003180 [Bremia lactucae]
MGHPSASPSAMHSNSPLPWDGKCHKCRKLMSRCICFQEIDIDIDSLRITSEAYLELNKSRPLWNALRKMHRTSTTSRPHPTNSKEQYDHKRSEALPPKAQSSSSRHPKSRPFDSSTRQEEPKREPSPERQSISPKDQMQYGNSTSSSSKDAGGMRSVQSASNFRTHDAFHDRLEKTLKLHCNPEDDETVWEL